MYFWAYAAFLNKFTSLVSVEWKMKGTGERCCLRKREKEGQGEERRVQGSWAGFQVLPGVAHGPHSGWAKVT